MLPHPSTYSSHQVHLLAAWAAQECHLERLTKRWEDRSQETALGFLQLYSVDHKLSWNLWLKSWSQDKNNAVFFPFFFLCFFAGQAGKNSKSKWNIVKVVNCKWPASLVKFLGSGPVCAFLRKSINKNSNEEWVQ